MRVVETTYSCDWLVGDGEVEVEKRSENWASGLTRRGIREKNWTMPLCVRFGKRRQGREGSGRGMRFMIEIG